MTSPRDHDRIAHMVEACDQAAEFVAGRTRDDLGHDRMLQLALVKLVEIVGEAAKAVSDDTRAQYPTVPWSIAARTRDRLTHHYFEVDLDVLWPRSPRVSRLCVPRFLLQRADTRRSTTGSRRSRCVTSTREPARRGAPRAFAG